MESQLVTANNAFEAITFSVYPNPVKESLKIEGLEGAFDYMIIDNTGRVIQQGSAIDNIEMSTLETGMYNLILKLDDVQKTIKIVKTK